MAAEDMANLKAELPNFESDFLVTVDHFKIIAIGRNHARTIGACGKGDQHVKVQVAQLVPQESSIRTQLPKELAGFQPILFRRRQDRMVPSQCPHEFPFGWFRGATPELRQHYGRGPDEAGEGLDSLLMTAATQIIDKNRRIEDDEVTHRDPRTGVSRRSSALNL